MRFSTPLVPARLIRRYKRFLADCRLESGAEVTAHCANPGAMTGLAEPGLRVWLEPNDDPRKKLHYGWRLVDHENGHFTGVDTGLPNRAVKAALEAGQVPGLPAYSAVRAEAVLTPGTRIDFVLQGDAGPIWVEVKSATLCRTPGLVEFPDTVTLRGAKHLAELALAAQRGEGAFMIYLVQRTDCDRFGIAADIDPAYATAFAIARAAGVRSLALDCAISPQGVTLRHVLPVVV